MTMFVHHNIDSNIIVFCVTLFDIYFYHYYLISLPILLDDPRAIFAAIISLHICICTSSSCCYVYV